MSKLDDTIKELNEKAEKWNREEPTDSGRRFFVINNKLFLRIDMFDFYLVEE